MKSLNDCLKYLRELFLSKIDCYDTLVIGYDEDIKSFEGLLDDLSSEEYDLIDYKDYNIIFARIFKNSEFNYAEKAKEAAKIIKICKDMNVNDLPQFIEAKKYFSLISKSLVNAISELKFLKKRDTHLIEFCQKYLPYLESKDTFIRLKEEDLFKLLDYIKKSVNDSQTNYDIIRIVFDFVKGKNLDRALNEIPHLEDNEISEINTFIKRIDELEVYYNGLSDFERHKLDNISLYLSSGNESIIDDNNYLFQKKFTKMHLLLKKLKREYANYLELKDNVESDVEYLSLLKEEIVLIRNILEQLRAIDLELPTRVNDDDNLNNLVIFLDDDGRSFFEEDLDELNSEHLGNYDLLNKFLDCLYHMNLLSYLNQSRNLKPSNGIADLSNDFKPYIIKKDKFIFAYSKLPVSKEMKDKLIEMYNLPPSFGVILIYGVKYARDDSYTKFNQRISREQENIRDMFNIYGGKFDESMLSFASDTIEDAFDITKMISDKTRKDSRV